MPRKLTHEEFLQKVSILNPNVEVLGRYAGSSDYIKVRCLHDGTVWYTMPQSLYLGVGCEKCKARKISAFHMMTASEFHSAVKNINPDVEIIGEYKGQKQCIAAHCNLHNLVWYPRADALLAGRGCNECKKKKQAASTTQPEEIVIDRIISLHPDIVLIGEYSNISNRTLFSCKKCGHEWRSSPNSLLSGHGCPKCRYIIVSEANALTHDDYLSRLRSINPYIELLEKYTRGRNRIHVRCSLCGNEWKPRADRLLEGNGCPACSSSRGERAVRAALEYLGVEYSHEHIFKDCRHKWPLRFDYFLPEINTAIEFQGRQHYMADGGLYGGEKELLDRQYRDQIKRDYCSANKIRLVEIPYWDLENVDAIIRSLVQESS